MEVNNRIPFNKPYVTGKELEYISRALTYGHISGNGYFTKQCQHFFEKKYSFKKCLLTTSCTDALEMAALLVGINPGDEVIVPSFTFVSSALAFVREGAEIKFVDSRKDHPGMDEDEIVNHITPRTKAIVVVHYAGVACDMDKIMAVAKAHNLYVIEDAAHSIDSFYNDRPLGSIGHLACFSFHETKNIQCGEGGMLVINDETFFERAEILWEKGTNRAKFFRGEIDKYGWVDKGSSFLPSDMLAAFLYAQLECIDDIQNRRLQIWKHYYQQLKHISQSTSIRLPFIPEYATNNAHMFYIICRSPSERSAIIDRLKAGNILSVFHYQSLHNSEYMRRKNQSFLPYSDFYSGHLLRVPFYYELTPDQIDKICLLINETVKYNNG